MSNICNVSQNNAQPTILVLTPEELTALVKHWVKLAIDDEYFIFWGQCFGNSDLRRIDRDWQRVNEIARVLGEQGTATAIEEAFLQTFQDFDRNYWIVFRYGTDEEQNSYQHAGGQAFDEFEDGIASNLASKVVERVFRDGPAEQQMKLLKEELKRYSVKLSRFKTGPHHIIEIFGIDFPIEIKQIVLKAGVEDPDHDPQHNTFFKMVTLEQGKAILYALDDVAAKGEDALEELVAGPGYFVNAAGLDSLMTKPGKTVRFSILPFKIATLSSSGTLIVPIVHYLNTESDGRYVKGADGALPLVEWGIKYLAMTKANVSEIESVVGPDTTPFNVDLIMSGDDYYRQFGLINKKARWTGMPELAAGVEKAATEASRILETKLSGKPGITILDDFRAVGPNHWNATEVALFLNRPLENGSQAEEEQGGAEVNGNSLSDFVGTNCQIR
jgi:hypothetical protein